MIRNVQQYMRGIVQKWAHQNLFIILEPPMDSAILSSNSFPWIPTWDVAIRISSCYPVPTNPLSKRSFLDPKSCVRTTWPDRVTRSRDLITWSDHVIIPVFPVVQHVHDVGFIAGSSDMYLIFTVFSVLVGSTHTRKCIMFWRWSLDRRFVFVCITYSGF